MVTEQPPVLSPVETDLEDDFPILELILRNYLADEDIMRIRKAYFFAYDAHKNQKRISGEPYIAHPICVAETLAEYQLDAETIMAGILHDVLEDTDLTYDLLAREFGEHVATMVRGVTKFSKISSAYRKEEEVENLRRMLVATASDLHVIMIKLADRLHNMRTLHFLSRDKQIRIAQNTLDIYAPLAHRLGLGHIKWELEDLCLMYILPHVYETVKKKVFLKRHEREKYIKEACQELQNALAAKNIQCTVEGRVKHFFSIYMKMQREHKSFEDLYDLVALRVLCETIGECYAILGEVHTMWRQVEGRFKDYISTPKPNNYRSIHTTVLGPKGRMVEIQIRTHDMHYIAEYGIAAHWRYKAEGSKRRIGRDAKWLEPFSQELPDTHDPEEFMQSIRHDLFSDEVFVYSPKGELIRLPKDSTPIDFAYKIHTELGHRCGGAKVNGRMVSLNYSLKTGDSVEILSNPNSHPSPAWLDIVKTASARNKIRRQLLESRRDELLKIGQSHLTREIQKAGFNPLEFYNSQEAQQIVESLKQKSLEDLFVNIGFGRISGKQIIARILQQKQKNADTSKSDEREKTDDEDQAVTMRSVVRLGDIDEIMYRRARCCSPLPGDDIIGFVTRGRGVTIHKSICPNIKHVYQDDPGRIMHLFWEEDQRELVSVTIEIRARDRRNLLSDLSQMISSTGTNIIFCKSATVNAVATFRFTLQINNSVHLNTVMQQLLGIEGVKNVRRVKGNQIPA
ncbi:MAG: bifunctional (p)ppGpp synthetase/guanosine-3',5'-bis(diphosphate) 3'-pyrophosphohydrolase [Candidatus Omnitrophota bacterium]|jgi:GTP pyrophosphokinase|nr:MAG: bifunctional (p)ppGpp synthetase/guanosine-3',5'-bis(diphosphate) 3'-pyrophosphohydrolase [Candidatus Omnitrophota bacterium]